MEFFVVDLRHRFDAGGFATFAIEEPLVPGEPPLCDACGSMVGPRPWLPPHRFKLSKGKAGDAVFGPSQEFFISPGFQAALESGGLLGFDEVPTTSTGPLLNRGYRLVRPKISYTRIDEDRIVWRGEPSCTRCRIRSWRSVSGVVVDLPTWDGSDLFVTTCFTGRMLASERLRKAVEENRLENFNLVPAEHYSESYSR